MIVQFLFRERGIEISKVFYRNNFKFVSEGNCGFLLKFY